MGPRKPEAENVAAYLLEKGRAAGKPMDRIGVLKLLYFVQGTALARLHQPAYWEKLKAWKHGPVVPQVWHKLQGDERVVTGIESGDPSAISDAARDAADCVWEEYGATGSWDLVDLTHIPGSPWDSIRAQEGKKPGEQCTAEIPTALIEGYFRRELPRLTEEELRAFPSVE